MQKCPASHTVVADLIRTLALDEISPLLRDLDYLLGPEVLLALLKAHGPIDGVSYDSYKTLVASSKDTTSPVKIGRTIAQNALITKDKLRGTTYLKVPAKQHLDLILTYSLKCYEDLIKILLKHASDDAEEAVHIYEILSDDVSRQIRLLQRLAKTPDVVLHLKESFRAT